MNINLKNYCKNNIWKIFFNTIINSLIIINFNKINKYKKLLTSYLIIKIITKNKIDFLCKHNFFINMIKSLIISNFLSEILIIIIKKNIFNINKKYFFIKKFLNKKKLNIKLVLIEKLNIIINPLNFYFMINYNLYIIKNINLLLINIIFLIIINFIKIKNNYKKIILTLLINIIPNILIGVGLFLSIKEFQNIYKICGIISNNNNLIIDQQVSGIIIWIIYSMMNLINLIVFKFI